MSGERNASGTLGNLLIFFGLTIIALGIYPKYFWVSRIKEQNAVLGRVLARARCSGEG